MRDIFIICAIIVIVIYTFKKPQVGILGWMWISIMNPHRQSFGWIYDFPLLDVIALSTILSVFINFKKIARAKPHPLLYLLVFYYIWVTLTTLFSVQWDLAFPKWLAFTKTMLFIFLMLFTMNKKHWIIATIAMFVLCIGQTGFKGGLFSLMTGGGYRIWGPPGTAWGDNNAVSLAMLMALPVTLALSSYIKSHNKWSDYTLKSFAVTFFITIFGTQSRGALVGVLGVISFYALRSKHKILAIFVGLISLATVYTFMPQSWHDRMSTILTHQEDQSASTRLIQWQYAMDIATERPFFGNGFNAFYHQPYYQKYVAHLDENRSVHSVYFEVLGEQGYIGFFIYMLLGVTAVFSGKPNATAAQKIDNIKWTAPFLFTLQYSFVGFAVNGLTINVAHIDLYYYLLAIQILLISQVKQGLAEEKVKAKSIATIKPKFRGATT